MKLKTFLNHVRQINNWKLTQKGTIRTKDNYCPLMAVNKKISGKPCSKTNYCECYSFSIDNYTPSDIAFIADYKSGNTRYRKLRKSLLAACKLKEQPV